MPATDYSYLGSGKVYLRPYGAAQGLVEVGNVSELTLGVNETTVSIKDFTQPGGGTRNEVRRIESVDLQMTMSDLSPENLARAVFGTTTAAAAGTGVAETATAYADSFVPLQYPPTNVTSVTDGGPTTYTEGTDYEVRPGGLYILPGTTIPDGSSITVTYDHAAVDVVQALVDSAKQWEIVFAGLNEARSGKEVVVTIHKATLGAAQQIPLVGEEYATVQVAGKLLADTSKGAGLSQYFKAVLVA